MANLFQLLQNGVQNLGNKLQNSTLFNKLKPNNQPVLQFDLADENGGIDYDKSLDLQQKYQPMTIKEKLTGRTLTRDESVTNPETGETQLVTHTNYKPGLFNDIAAGYKENRNTPISLSNFGEHKGAGFRVGEALGSLARIGESPLGRGLLTGAAIAALGGTPAETLAYGATAGALNQANRSRDSVYRQQMLQSLQDSLKNGSDWENLTADEQAAKLQEAERFVNGIRGYVNDDTYKNFIHAQQLRDNAEYRKMYFNNQLKQQEEARQDRALQREMQNKIAQGQLGLGYARLGEDVRHNKAMEEVKINSKVDKDQVMSGLRVIDAQLKNLQDGFENANNPYRYRIAGGVSQKLNTLTPAESNFNSQTSLLFNPIARTLGGEKGVLSDQDIARIREGMPTLADTNQQKHAKMKAIFDLVELRCAEHGIHYDNPYSSDKFDVKTGKFITNDTNNTDVPQTGLNEVPVPDNFLKQPHSVNNLEREKMIKRLKDKGFSDSDINDYLKKKGL